MKFKTIILIMLFVLLVCFQGMPGRSQELLSGREIFIVEFLELYQQYETWCWNDSTLIISGGGQSYYPETSLDSLGRKVLDLTEIIAVDAVYVIKKEWVHKEQSFSGFVTWLKKSSKSNLPDG